MMFNKGLLENNVPVNKLKKKRFYNINVLETISGKLLPFQHTDTDRNIVHKIISKLTV